MRTITIQRLTLANFKGCHSLTLDFQGRDCSIYGDNATGKTTVYDAFCWLLFGKDSSGAAKFDIKPLDETGAVADHGAETSVEAILSVDGQEVTLKRTYFELWSKKRGNKEASFDGHSSGFYFNGLPMAKNEFSSRVAQLCDENSFRTLTDLRWFCAGESETNRRAALFDLVEDVSDEDVLASDQAFAPLADALGGLTVEEAKAAYQKQRRNLQTKAKTTPARIDEQKRTISEYEAVDFTALRTRRDELAGQESAAREALEQLRSKAGTSALLPQRDGLRMQLEALESQNTAYRSGQRTADPTQLRRQKEGLERQGQAIARELERNQLSQQQGQAAIQACRERWKETQSMTFSGGTCPTCGQTLPAGQLAKATDEFEQRKKEHLAKLAEDAGARKAELEALQARADELRADQAQNEQDCAELAQQLAAAEALVITDLDGYGERKTRLTSQLQELEAQITQASRDTRQAEQEAERRWSETREALRRTESALAGEQFLDAARKRVAELMAEQQQTAAETERLDSLLDLCDQFTRVKAEYISREVSGRFRLVRWQLFEEQINGGLRDCCKATIDGVPYANLNNGAKINAGLDVIATLSQAKGIRCPLFVDNAESVTQLLEMDTQVIRMVVSKTDKQLRLERED